ncbi:MAG: L,D-transpeptidase family protein, partial [Campylobacterales bacterium]|nr:L,D-transpeptidase family protein [Campylobacterales bacterium]
LDRIKWLTRKEYTRHVVINIPAFKLNFYSGGKSIQSMRVITGTWKNPTPIFSDTVTTIVLNPYWNVPASILEKEMILNLRSNSSYLSRKNMKLYSHDGKSVDPSSVDWKQYRKGSKIPYRVAQSPGYGNALGKIKFLFPNRYAVYMHDTPTKSLFKRNVRAFSHGCIRLQDPRGLLKTFSNFNSNVNYTAATNTLKGSARRAIALNNQVPIDVVYLTAFIDEKGVLNFRNDIYGYDRYQY